MLVERLRVHHEQHFRRRRRLAPGQACSLEVEVGAEHVAQGSVLVPRWLRHLLRHVRWRRFRCGNGNRLQEARREALEALLDAALEAVGVERLGDGHLHHRLAVGEREVEVEGVGVEQARRHGAEAEVLGDLQRDRAIAGVGVHHLHRQLAVRLGLKLREHGVEIDTQVGKRLRQLRRRREIADKGDVVADAVEHAAAALKAEEHLLDAAGDVVFGVAKLHVEVCLAPHLDVDQFAKAEHFVFVAVLDEHVEIGVDEARLIAVCHLKRHRADAVLGVGLVLEFRIVRRIDQFEAHLAVAGHFVFRQQVLELRCQRREQRMGLLAEVAANQERLAQLPEIAVGGVGNRVLVALGHIPAQEADVVQPNVGDDEVGGEKPEDGKPPSVSLPCRHRRAVPRPRPTEPLNHVDIACQNDGGERGVEPQVAEIKHAPGDGFEPGTRADAAQGVCHATGEEVRQERMAHHVEPAAEQHREDQGDDLVVAARALEEANRKIGGAEEARCQIARDHGAPVEVA